MFVGHHIPVKSQVKWGETNQRTSDLKKGGKCQRRRWELVEDEAMHGNAMLVM